MEVPHPPAKAGVHVTDNIVQRYPREFPRSLLLDTHFDFRKRFRGRAYMRILFTRLPTRTHPDFKTQEGEAFFSGVNYVRLDLVKREIKAMQHLSYPRQRRFYSALHSTTKSSA